MAWQGLCYLIFLIAPLLGYALSIAHITPIMQPSYAYITTMLVHNFFRPGTLLSSTFPQQYIWAFVNRNIFAIYTSLWYTTPVSLYILEHICRVMPGLYISICILYYMQHSLQDLSSDCIIYKNAIDICFFL